MWTTDRTYIPWWDIVHWWLGRCLFALAAINIILGFVEYKSNYDLPIAFPILFAIFMTFGAGVTVFGEIYFGQIHHVSTDVAVETNGGSGKQDKDNGWFGTSSSLASARGNQSWGGIYTVSDLK